MKLIKIGSPVRAIDTTELIQKPTYLVSGDLKLDISKKNKKTMGILTFYKFL